ncbi:unnamed protein product [Closterium sp. NIES-65]|nr:unnamed protein product [Closterium sp. NIES-65]
MAHKPKRDPPVLLPPGELAGQHRTGPTGPPPPGELAGQQHTGPTGPPPPWGARWPAPHRTHRSSSPLGSSLASTAQDHRPPPHWGSRWPAPHRTHRSSSPGGSSSPLGSSLASTAQDPPVLLPPGELAGQHRTGPTGPPPPGELAGQHRTGPTGPPPPWGARWPAPHRTHRSSSPLGSSLASTAQDPPVLLPTGDLAGQHRIGPTGPPPPWGARWPAPHRTHRSSSPLGSSLASTAQDPPVLLPPGELAGQHRTGPTGPPPPWGARWPAPHRTHRSSSPLGSSLASTAQDPPVLLPPGELAGQHRTGAHGVVPIVCRTTRLPTLFRTLFNADNVDAAAPEPDPGPSCSSRPMTGLEFLKGVTN